MAEHLIVTCKGCGAWHDIDLEPPFYCNCIEDWRVEKVDCKGNCTLVDHNLNYRPKKFTLDVSAIED